MITRVGQNSAEANTVTIPSGHQVGDFLLVFAFRDGSAVNPTVPAGWTTITNTLDTTSGSASVGWKIAASSSETSGTWTNATGLIVLVYRGVDNPSPWIAGTTSNAVSTTITYGGITDANLKGVSGYRICAIAAHRSIDTTIDTPPTGMANIVSALGATQDMAAHEINSEASAWASTNVSIGGTSSGWVSIVLALRKARMNFNNYEHAGAQVGNAGVISVTEKIR